MTRYGYAVKVSRQYKGIDVRVLFSPANSACARALKIFYGRTAAAFYPRASQTLPLPSLPLLAFFGSGRAYFLPRVRPTFPQTPTLLKPNPLFLAFLPKNSPFFSPRQSASDSSAYVAHVSSLPAIKFLKIRYEILLQMGAESWLARVFRVPKKKTASVSSDADKALIGVLSFEVASLMSKIVYLWQSLGDDRIARLRGEILNSEGVRKLVSDDEEHLVGLALAEMLDAFGFVARAAARLGKRCTSPVLRGLEPVFDDLVKNASAGAAADPYGLEFTWKKMTRKVKKIERFIAASTSLYQEMEVLAELEQAMRRMMQGSDGDANRSAGLAELQQKVAWQRQEMKSVRQKSLWCRTYDYTVRLLVRSLFTVFGRIKQVFGIPDHHLRATSITAPLNYLPRSQSISGLLQSTVHPSEISLPAYASGPLDRMPGTKSGPLYTSNSGPLRPKNKRSLPATRPFKGCITGGGGGGGGDSGSSFLDSYKQVGRMHPRSNAVISGILKQAAGNKEESIIAHSSVLDPNLSFFNSKYRFLSNPPPSTLGAAALALHYANVIIVIEKFVTCPHLIAPDARDDLYNMLPTSIRAALRAQLKSYVKDLSSLSYDAVLAAEWTSALGRILEWLAPLAHNMIRWQSERTFEQQHIVSRTNVLLIQTLFYANQAKTEAAITELLVGLNYICMFQGELNRKALLEASGGLDFGDYLDGNG
ncbi:hypothetical protein ACLOJK_020774 [Asimina triloba]